MSANGSVLKFDFDAKRKPLKRVWEMGFNTCHGPLVMRSDVQAHMKRAHNELGMQYWRCHGLFNDDVGIIVRNADGTLDYAFSGLKRIIDAGLSTGVKPFFEMSFTPAELARDASKLLMHYRSIVSPPKDFKAWAKLISKTMRFLVNTYGLKEVRSWYFELWNEPNIPFWDGTREEYFLLYKETALAIKSVDSKLRVGGPATAKAEWIPELLEFCKNEKIPLDFISTHIYPSDVAFTESTEGDVKLLGLDYIYKHFARVQTEVAKSGFKIPIFWGEWNSSAGPFATNHDDANNAAFICGALSGMAHYSDGSLYWNLSDVYEEGQYHFTPFHGGYGLYTVDDIPKAAARAFEFYTHLLPHEISVSHEESSQRHGILASIDKSGKKVCAVLWNHIEEEDQQPLPWKGEIELGGRRTKRVDTRQIVSGAGSAYEPWIEMGRPPTLTPPQLRELAQASKPISQTRKFRATQNTIPFSIPAGSAMLLEFAVSK